MYTRAIIFILLLINVASVSYASEKPLKELVFGFDESMNMDVKVWTRHQWLERALHRLGYRLKDTPLPSKRILRELNMGLIDGDFAKAPETVADLDHIVRVDYPFFTACFAAFGFDNQQSYPPASNPRIVQVKEWPYTEKPAAKYWENATLLSPLHFPQVLPMLKAKRADLVIMPMSIHQTLLNEDASKLVQQSPPLIMVNTFIHLHESHRELALALKQALADTKPKNLTKCTL